MDRDPGSPWRCVRCDVGVTAMKRPDCWNCGQSDRMVEAHQYHAPTSAAFLHPMIAHLTHVTVTTEEP